MSMRRLLALLGLWIVLMAALAGLVIALRQPQPPQASLGSLSQAVIDTQRGSGSPALQISTDPHHAAVVSSGQVVWWNAAGDEYSTAITDQSVAISIFTAHDYSNFGADTGIPASTLALVIVPTLIIIGVIVVLYWRQGAGGPMSLLHSRSRTVAVRDRPPTRFSDVAGCDEVKVEMGELVDFLRDPGHYHDLGARVPKGVLLAGAPGTGKTLLARAVAGEADCAFIAVSGSEFVEMFVGVGASRVRRIFAQARRSAPCIVFVDEIDAVGRRRGDAGYNHGQDEREQTLNQLLVEMDGFDQEQRIVVIGATNRPDVLDEALLRPGRFDRRVNLDPPDVAGRSAILALHARGKPLSDDADLELVARRTPGFTGADLASLVNEAALLAARERCPAIGPRHLEMAVDRVLAGPERRGRLISLRERRIVAYHEMGHALVLTSLPEADPVHRISIIGRGRSLGWTLTVPEDDQVLTSRSQLTDRLTGLLGGRAAEEIVLGEGDITTGGSDDLLTATQLARQMVTQFGMSGLGVRVVENGALGAAHSEELQRRVDAEVDRLLDSALHRAREMLVARRDQLDRLAERLLEVETMDAGEMASLIDPVTDLHGVPVARHRHDGRAPGAATPVPASVAAMARSVPPSAAIARAGGLRARVRAVFGARGRPGRGSLAG
jgi:cell division protease FtsH